MTRAKVIGLIIAATTVTGAVIIGAAASQNEAPVQQEKPYEYAALGNRCDMAANQYEQQAEALKQEVEKTAVEGERDLAATRQAITSSTDSGVQSLNKVRDDYWKLYVEGGISSEDYKKKIQDLDQLESSTYTTPGSQYSAELNRIEGEFRKHIDAARTQAVTYKENAVKLKACADAANRQQDFTVGDVADFESLISGVQ